MKARALVHCLLNLDPETEVIIARDAEGNSYSPLYMVQINYVYIPINAWYGEAWPKAEPIEGVPVSEGPDAQDAVILVPTC